MATAFAVTGSVRSLGATGVPALDAAAVSNRVATPIRYREGAEPTSARTGTPGIPRMAANTVAAFAFTLLCALLAFAFLPMVVGYRPVVVTSGSMEPGLRRSDVVVLAPTPRKKLPAGTVINFGTPEGDVIHRIVEVTPGGYRTRGDANAVDDSTTVATHGVNGVGAFLVPFIGQPALWADDGDWLELGTVVVLVTLCARIGQRKWLSPTQRRRTRGRRDSPRDSRRLVGKDHP